MTYVSCVSPVILRKLSQSMPWLWLWPATGRLYKAYNKVRENDFSLAGLMGFNFYGKIAGIIGTGRIGAAMCRICNGFGMKVIAYDVYENPDLKDFVTYVTLDELLAQSDLISLHCPLMDSTYHLIQLDTIKKMKDGVILVNTSRVLWSRPRILSRASACTSSPGSVWMSMKKRRKTSSRIVPMRFWSILPPQGFCPSPMS